MSSTPWSGRIACPHCWDNTIVEVYVDELGMSFEELQQLVVLWGGLSMATGKGT